MLLVELIELLIQFNLDSLLLKQKLIDNFKESDFKNRIISHIASINLVSEKPIYIEGVYSSIVESDIDKSLIELQIDLSKNYVYYEIGHSGEWHFYEIDSNKNSIFDDMDFIENMFVSSIYFIDKCFIQRIK